MSTAKHDKDTSNSTKLTDNDTRKVINRTFDDAKNKARKAIDESQKWNSLDSWNDVSYPDWF
jgi:Zn/Cd-binding protein ZinT